MAIRLSWFTITIWCIMLLYIITAYNGNDIHVVAVSSFTRAAATTNTNNMNNNGPDGDVCFGTDKTDVRLEHVTLLLPATIEGQTRHLAPFVLRASGGCFKSGLQGGAHKQLISIRPVLPSSRCDPPPGEDASQFSTALEITPRPWVSVDHGRDFQWVYMEEKTKNAVQRCEVFVDRIARIEILTSSREVTVGTPEWLTVQAYDAIGNVFSSLDGLEFEWTLKANQILLPLKFDEAKMDTSETRRRMEKAGLGTDVLPIRAVGPGRATVTVRLVDSASPVPIERTIEFSVSQPIFPYPERAYITPASDLQLLLCRNAETGDCATDRAASPATDNIYHQSEAELFGNGGHHDGNGGMMTGRGNAPCGVPGQKLIRLPSLDYKWHPTNASCIDVDPDQGLVTGRVLGFSRALVAHVSLPDKSTDGSDIYVVNPTRIELRIFPSQPYSRRYCSDPALWTDRAQCDVTSIERHRAASGCAATDNTASPTSSSASVSRQSAITSGREWVLADGTKYIIEILVFSGDHCVEVGQNMRFNVSFVGGTIAATVVGRHSARAAAAAAAAGNANALASGHALCNASVASAFQSTSPFIGISATKLGSSLVTVSLERVVNTRTGQIYSISPPLIASTAIRVSSPIRVVPGPVVVLPVSGDSDPSSPRNNFNLLLTANGGSGHYVWKSSHLSIVHVSEDGWLSTRGGGEGTSFVTVTDACDPENKAIVTVHVSQPAAIQYLSKPLEVQVGREFQLAVNVSDKLGRSYSNCSNLNLATTVIHGQSSLKVITPDDEAKCSCPCPRDPSAGCCWIIEARGLSPDYALLRSSIKFPFVRAGVVVPEADKVLAIFAPLQATPSPIVMGVGTHLNLTWTGGPLPWPASCVTADTWQSGRLPFDAHHHIHDITMLTSRLVQTGASQNEYNESVLEFPHPTWPQTLDRRVSFRHPDNDIYTFPVECVEARDKPLTLVLRVCNAQSNCNPEPVCGQVAVSLSCYPAMRLKPRVVVLPVGGLRTVEAITHPDGKPHPLTNNLTYYIEDDVASVDSNGTVTGLELGESLLHGFVNHSSLRTLPYDRDTLHDTVHVQVKFRGFKIRMYTTELLQGHETWAHIEGLDGEMPGDAAFEHVHCEWQCDSTAVELLPPLTSDGLADDEATPNGMIIRGFNVRVLAHSPSALAVIRANVTVRNPRNPRLHPEEVSDWIEIQTFAPSLDVTVLEPLTILSPQKLLLPPGAVSEILTSLHDSTGVIMNYSVLVAPTSCSGDCQFVSQPITVDARGVVHAKDAEELPSQRGDAVVFVRTVPAPGTRQTTYQTAAVEVAVRPVQHISLRAVDSLTGPLCVGSNVSVEVVLRDELGRAFSSLEGWGGDDGAAASLAYKCTRPEFVRVQKKSLTRPVASGSSPSLTHTSNGVVAIVSFSALALPDANSGRSGAGADGYGAQWDEGYTSVVVKMWLNNHTEIDPIYLRIHVADSLRCEEPAPARVNVFLTDDASLPSVAKRNDWETGFKSDVSRALHIPVERIVMVWVNSTDKQIAFDIHPPHWLQPVHPHQWHLAHSRDYLSYADTAQTAGTPGFREAERWTSSVELAQQLQTQLYNDTSVLRSGSYTRYINAAMPMRIARLPSRTSGRVTSEPKLTARWLDGSEELDTIITIGVNRNTTIRGRDGRTAQTIVVVPSSPGWFETSLNSLGLTQFAILLFCTVFAIVLASMYIAGMGHSQSAAPGNLGRALEPSYQSAEMDTFYGNPAYGNPQ